MREVPGLEVVPQPPAELIARLASLRRRPSRQELIDGILSGNRTILARAITLIESVRPQDRDLAEEVLDACLPHTGNSVRVGITGVPGAGKSSLIEVLGNFLTNEYQQKVAVLAIDPSSRVSGGSILGDKTRMATLSANDMAFVRPSPSRCSLGGVAQRTRESMLLCEAAGYKNILIETVGVGQSEIAVRDMVDFFMLIAIAGAGDELQGMKRGIMEMADLVAVNKADSDNVIRAQRARMEVEAGLHYFPMKASQWCARAITCSAAERKGLTELWDAVLEHRAQTQQNGWFDLNRSEQVNRWMEEIIIDGLRQRFEEHPLVRERKIELERDVLEGRTTSFRAARVLLELYAPTQK